MTAIFRRELKAYFSTATGYLFIGSFLMISGLFFIAGNVLQRSSNFAGFLNAITFLFLFAVPILTMRLFATERAQQTDRLLYTTPISIGAIVFGKYLAAFVLFLGTLALTLIYALMIAIFGELQIGVALGAYAGFALMFGSLIAVGVLVSALSESPVAATIVSFLVLLTFWILPVIQRAIPTGPAANQVFAVVVVGAVAAYAFSHTRSVILASAIGVVGLLAVGLVRTIMPESFAGMAVRLIVWVNLLGRFDNFVIGLVRADDVLFYLSFSGFILYLTARVIEKRRWT